METVGRIGTVGLETSTCPAILTAFEQTLRKQYLFTFPAKTLTKSPGFTNAEEVALLERSASTRYPDCQLQTEIALLVNENS
jgi:hypothetical protein